MPTIETKVTVFARPSMPNEERRADGVTVTSEHYGKVDVIHRVTTSRISTRGAVLGEPVRQDSVVLRGLDTHEVAHLIKTLASSLATSLDTRDTGLRGDLA